jgi:hypothetical protein
MRPNLPHRVTIRTPGPPTVDPVTGNERPGPPVVETGVPARLSQSPVGNISQQAELLATQNTVISFWTILTGPRSGLASNSEVEDEDTGRKFVVAGQVARRPDRHPQFLAAAARLISDMQA